MEKSYNVAGLPVIQEQYTFKGEECYRNYIDGTRLSIENCSVMHLTTYENKDSDKHDWCTKTVFAAPESRGLGQAHYFNYYRNAKGLKLSHKRALAHAERRGDKQADIDAWYKKAESTLKAHVIQNRTKSTRTNTSKNPVYYTAPLRHSTGSKPFMSNACALIVEDDNGDVLKEVIMVGDVIYEHSPSRQSSYIKKSKDSTIPVIKRTNSNGYSYTKVRLWSDIETEDDWLDESNDYESDEYDLLLEAV